MCKISCFTTESPTETAPLWACDNGQKSCQKKEKNWEGIWSSIQNSHVKKRRKIDREHRVIFAMLCKWLFFSEIFASNVACKGHWWLTLVYSSKIEIDMWCYRKIKWISVSLNCMGVLPTHVCTEVFQDLLRLLSFWGWGHENERQIV